MYYIYFFIVYAKSIYSLFVDSCSIVYVCFLRCLTETHMNSPCIKSIKKNSLFANRLRNFTFYYRPLSILGLAGLIDRKKVALLVIVEFLSLSRSFNRHATGCNACNHSSPSKISIFLNTMTSLILKIITIHCVCKSL